MIGIGLHLMIALMMKDLIFFSAQMWTFYALFVVPEQWRWVGEKLLEGLEAASLIRRTGTKSTA